MPYQYWKLFLTKFPHSQYFPEHRLLTWHPRGILDDTMADAVVTVLETDETLGVLPFNRYADLSQLTEIHLKADHVFHLAKRRRSAAETVRSAFFSDTTVGLGIARMYESLMEGAFIHVRAFPSRDDAAEWLNVPVKVLQPE